MPAPPTTYTPAGLKQMTIYQRGNALVKTLGLSALPGKLKAKGGKIAVTAEGVFQAKGPAGAFSVDFGMTPVESILLATSPKSSPLWKWMRVKVRDRIKKALGEHGPGAPAVDPLGDGAGPMPSTDGETIAPQDLATLADKKGKGEADMATFPTCSVAEMIGDQTVKLRHATKLYQPVQGTSGTSRYFVVAVCTKLAVAVRWKGAKMAIRIEGSLLENTSARKALALFGFTNIGEKYGSMHLPASDSTLARKLLGSVLMGVAMDWDSPWPDVMRLHGKGS